MALAISVDVAERSESALGATPAWRRAARAAFAALPRGSQTRCAEDVGLNKGTLTQLLDGRIAFSPFVGPVSDWLGIDRPRQVTQTAEEVEALDLYRHADAAGRAIVLAMLRKLSKP